MKNSLFLAGFALLALSETVYSQCHVGCNGPYSINPDNDNTGDKEFYFKGWNEAPTLKIQAKVPASASNPINTSDYDKFYYQKSAFIFPNTESAIFNFDPNASANSTNMLVNSIRFNTDGIELRGPSKYSSWGPMNYRADTDNTGDGDHNFYGSNNTLLLRMDNPGNMYLKGSLYLDNTVKALTAVANTLSLTVGTTNVLTSNVSGSVTTSLYAGSNIFLTGGSNQTKLSAGGLDAIIAQTNKLQLTPPGGTALQSIIVTNNGVGIGTETPTAKLQVAGNVKASAFIATTTHFPDYVFSKNYALMPLETLSKYVEDNKHLPGMPSEQEVVKEGMDLKQISTISVEKIEELYLHVIQLNNRIKQLETQLSGLQTK